MSEPTRKIMRNAVLALIFAGALGGAWVRTRHSQAAPTPRSVPMIWHAAYPSTFFFLVSCPTLLFTISARQGPPHLARAG